MPTASNSKVGTILETKYHLTLKLRYCYMYVIVYNSVSTLVLQNVVKDSFHLGPRPSSLGIVSSLVLQLVPKSVWYHIPMTGRMVSQQILSHILPTIT